MTKRASDDELSQGSSSKRRRTYGVAPNKATRRKLVISLAPTSRRTTRAQAKAKARHEPQIYPPPTAPVTVVELPQRLATPNQTEERRTIHLTPSSSFKTPESIDEISTRARDADPNRGHCFMTNQPEAQVVHALDPNTPNAELDTLQEAWQMVNLHPDTRHNIFFLSEGLRYEFESDDWIMMPDPITVDLLFAAYSETGAVSIANLYGGATEFTYYMIPRGGANDEPIFRNVAGPGRPWQTQMIKYPYEALGPLRSHVFPHLAIVNAALKFKDLRGDYAHNTLRILRAHDDPVVQHRSDVDVLIVKILRLYGVWMKDLDKHQAAAAVTTKARTNRVHHIVPELLDGLYANASGSSNASEEEVQPAIPVGKQDPDILQWASESTLALPEQKNELVLTMKEATKKDAGQLKRYALERTPRWLKRVNWRDHFPAWAVNRSRPGFTPVTSEFSSNDWSAWRANTILWRTRHV